MEEKKRRREEYFLSFSLSLFTVCRENISFYFILFYFIVNGFGEVACACA